MKDDDNTAFASRHPRPGEPDYKTHSNRASGFGITEPQRAKIQSIHDQWRALLDAARSSPGMPDSNKRGFEDSFKSWLVFYEFSMGKTFSEVSDVDIERWSRLLKQREDLYSSFVQTHTGISPLPQTQPYQPQQPTNASPIKALLVGIGIAGTMVAALLLSRKR